MEMKTNIYNRKYLQVPKSLNSIGIYITTNALQLSRIKEKIMVVRKRGLITLKKSKNPKVASGKIEVRTGRKWHTQVYIEKCEKILSHKALIEIVSNER